MSQKVRVYVGQLAEGRRELPSEAAHYVARVHRLAANDRFVVFDPESALECDAEVVRVSHGRVQCTFGAPRPAVRIGTLPVTLLQAAPKSDRLEDVVRAATALGARAVHLLRTERSVLIPTDKQRQRLKSIAIDGARQSGRGDLPALLGPSTLEEATERELASVRLCLHPRAPVSLDSVAREHPPQTPTCLCIGPEGGFSEDELGLLTRRGFQLVALGPSTLRSELAATVALGYFAARFAGASADAEPAGPLEEAT